MKKSLQIFFFLSISILSKAQPNFPPPTGIYCSCPPTTTNVSLPGSVDPTVAAKPFVKGILVRASWADMEPSDNSYNWTLIDNQITAANSFGKKISLAIGGGPNSPAWIYTLGVQSQSFTVPFTGTVPVIWDATFLNKWTEFVRALGNKYKNDTTIRLVYITNGTGNGFEMQLPFNPTPSFTSISYTDQKVINSWKRVIDTFKVAFPNHYLTNDFHPVNSSNAVADSVYLYARTKLPNRYGANAWWWTQNNTTLYASQYSILQHSSSNNIFSGVQIARSHTTDSALFGAGGIYGALSLAISNNVCYWEVWNQDIINTKLNALFTNSTTCTTLTDIHNKQNENEQIVIYPNPCSGRISLSIKTTAEFILIDRIGKIVFKKIITEDNSQNIQLPILPSGVYFARLETNGQYHYKKLMIEY